MVQTYNNKEWIDTVFNSFEEIKDRYSTPGANSAKFTIIVYNSPLLASESSGNISDIAKLSTIPLTTIIKTSAKARISLR